MRAQRIGARPRPQATAGRQRQQGRQNAVLATQLLDQLDRQSSFLNEAAEAAALLQLSPAQVLQALRRALTPPGWVTLMTGARSDAQ
ncbi:hypothetical protein [Roseateles sp.]|uniref:hypothetical protein n=1 Tax=Roseateles sp. TaxID=1971397 RepID=UPI003BACEFEC